jgi:hypothetical protein
MHGHRASNFLARRSALRIACSVWFKQPIHNADMKSTIIKLIAMPSGFGGDPQLGAMERYGGLKVFCLGDAVFGHYPLSLDRVGRRIQYLVHPKDLPSTGTGRGGENRPACLR